MGFSSQSYHHAWDILYENYVRSDVTVKAQFKKIHTHPPIRPDNSTSIVKFANAVKNVVNTLTQLGYTSDLEAEAGLISTMGKRFAATERTVVAAFARSSTNERQPDCFQGMPCLHGGSS